MSEATKMPLRNLKMEPGLAPATDDVLLYLFRRAVVGGIPVYFAAIPMKLIRPFDVPYDPRNHPAGKAAVLQISHEWREGKFSHIWVYPDERGFVMSDDYITYYAAVEGQPDYLPCWVLGFPDHPEAKDVQGPIMVENVRRMLFSPS